MRKFELIALSLSLFFIGCTDCPNVSIIKDLGKSLKICGQKSPEENSTVVERSPQNIQIRFLTASNQFEVNGQDLDLFERAQIRNSNTVKSLRFDLKTASKILLGFAESSSLLAGVYTVLLSTARADQPIMVNLEVADGTITDSKIVSMDATKVTGTLSLSNIPNLSALYSSITHSHVANDIGAVDTTSGAADAGKVVKLDNSGKINLNMLSSEDSRSIVSLASPQTITTGNWATAIYDNIFENTKSEYNSSTGIVSLINPGLYQISATSTSAASTWTSGQHCAIGIYVNSTELVAYNSQTMPTATASCSAAVSTTVYFSTPGTVQVKVYHSRGADTDLMSTSRAYNSFSVFRVK